MPVDDADLVARCRGGDRDAFAELVDRYEGPIFNLALRMVGDRDDARDIAQTAFANAFERLAGYDPRYRFYGWLYRIAINESLDFLKRSRPTVPPPDGLASDGPDPERSVGGAEVSRAVQRALMSMPPDQRTIIVLRHFLDCSYHDIGAILDVPEKTVKSRLFTARHALRDLLSARGVLRA